jgi:beta-aspartyl-peptidase (threonine type)
MASHTDTAVLGRPALVVHGGAGAFAAVSCDEDVAVLTAALEESTAAGWSVLAAGGSALDAVVEAVASLEDSGCFNAGRGAVPTDDGTVELDASVMDGVTGRVGALCAATRPANPVRAARAVAELRGVPDGPVLLAGTGADRFCEEEGLEAMRPEWLRAHGGSGGAVPLWSERSDQARAPGPVISEEGTVGAVAVDAAGGVAAATSTGGRTGQRRGRVGDSPIPGAGVLAVPLARSGSVAVSATGAGEAFLVTGFAHRIAWEIEHGSSLVEATEHALAVVGQLGGTGGGIAVDAAGQMVASFTSPAMARAWRGSGTGAAYLFPR